MGCTSSAASDAHSLGVAYGAATSTDAEPDDTVPDGAFSETAAAAKKPAGRSKRTGASRYAVAAEDDDEGDADEGGGGAAARQQGGGGGGGGGGFYTNIGDFEDQSNAGGGGGGRRRSRRRRGRGAADTPVEVVGDLKDFAASLKDGGGAQRRGKQHIMVGDVESLPGQQLGAFGEDERTEQETHATSYVAGALHHNLGIDVGNDPFHDEGDDEGFDL